MAYILNEYKEEFDSSNLRLKNDNRLDWEGSSGVDYLLLQFAFDEELDYEKICRRLEDGANGYTERFVELYSGVYVKYVSSIEKVRNGGCYINSKGCRYIVLSIRKIGDDYNLYKPNPDRLRESICDAPLSIDINIREEELIVKTGIFSKETTIFYAINFVPYFERGYTDGDLCYSVRLFDNSTIEIPITKEMIDAKTVYVKKYKPMIGSKNSRLKYKITEG